MKCPYCNKEMILGHIQCRDGIFWSEKKRKTSAFPPLDKSAINLGGSPFFGNASVEAYQCSECKKVIIDYDNKS